MCNYVIKFVDEVCMAWCSRGIGTMHDIKILQHYNFTDAIRSLNTLNNKGRTSTAWYSFSCVPAGSTAPRITSQGMYKYLQHIDKQKSYNNSKLSVKTIIVLYGKYIVVIMMFR